MRKLGYQIFYFFIRIGSFRLAYPLLYFVVFYYCLFPSTKKKSNYYLKKRFPNEKSKLKFFLLRYKLILNFGITLVDKAIIGILGTKRIKVEQNNKSKILDILKDNGLILMSAHLGGWQVFQAFFDFFNKPVNMLMEINEGEEDKFFFDYKKKTTPFNIINTKSFLGGGIEITQAIDNKEVICVMGDRTTPDNKNNIKVKFLNNEINISLHIFRIASLTNTPIAIVFFRRLGKLHYDFQLLDLFYVPKNLAKDKALYLPYVLRFVNALESFVEENPYQFFNFFDIWEQ